MWHFVNLCLGVFKWHHFDDYTVKGQTDVREAEGRWKTEGGKMGGTAKEGWNLGGGDCKMFLSGAGNPTNPVARINFSDVRFCKQWLCYVASLHFFRISLEFCFVTMLCYYALVGFRHRKPLGQGYEKIQFSLKIPVLSLQTQLEMSHPPAKDIKLSCYKRCCTSSQGLPRCILWWHPSEVTKTSSDFTLTEVEIPSTAFTVFSLVTPPPSPPPPDTKVTPQSRNENMKRHVL